MKSWIGGSNDKGATRTRRSGAGELTGEVTHASEAAFTPLLPAYGAFANMRNSCVHQNVKTYG